MAPVEFPVGTLFAAALKMPFRHLRALLRLGLLPLLIATIALPPTVDTRSLPLAARSAEQTRRYTIDHRS